MAEKGLTSLEPANNPLLQKQQLLAERIRKGGETSSAPDLKQLKEVYDNMSALDKAALLTAPIPLVGDVVGGVADTAALIEDPSLVNAGLMAAGLIPLFLQEASPELHKKFFPSLKIKMSKCRIKSWELHRELLPILEMTYRVFTEPMIL